MGDLGLLGEGFLEDHPSFFKSQTPFNAKENWKSSLTGNGMPPYALHTKHMCPWKIKVSKKSLLKRKIKDQKRKKESKSKLNFCVLIIFIKTEKKWFVI